MNRTLALLALAGAAACTPAVLAEDVGQITVFGTLYDLQRFDTSTVLIPDELNAGLFINLIRVEGTTLLDSSRLIMTTRYGNEFFGSYNFYAVTVNLDADTTGKITGLSYGDTLVVANGGTTNPINHNGFTTARGVAINTKGTPSTTDDTLVLGRDRTYQFPLTSGQFQGGPVLPGDFANNPQNEDVAYVTSLNEFWILNQPADRVHRYTQAGVAAGTFNIGFARNGALASNSSKGLTFLPDSPAFPAIFQGLGGVAIVAHDDTQPSLEVYRASDRSFVAREALNSPDATDASGTGAASRLPLDNCGMESQQIESLAADPATGRLFLTQQGDGFLCEYLWILTPVAADSCGSTDFDGDGDEGTDADIEAFFAVIGGGACPTATCGSVDFDGDGDEGTDADIEAFFRVIGGGAC